MKFFSVQFLAAFVDFHLVGQRKRNIEFDFLSGFFERYGKFSGLTGNPGHHGAGLDTDVGELLQLVDFFGDHRCQQAIVRFRSGQLAAPFERVAAQLILLFDDGHLIAGLGRIDCRRDPGDAAADHQNFLALIVQQMGFRQFNLFDTGHSHFDVVGGQHLDVIDERFIILLLLGGGRPFVTRMRPHHLLTQAHAVDDTSVKAKHIIEHPARAGTDHQGVDPIGDVLLEQLDAFGAAENRMGFDGQPFLFGHFAQVFRCPEIHQFRTLGRYTHHIFYPWITSLPLHQSLNRFERHAGCVLVG